VSQRLLEVRREGVMRLEVFERHGHLVAVRRDAAGIHLEAWDLGPAEGLDVQVFGAVNVLAVELDALRRVRATAYDRSYRSMGMSLCDRIDALVRELEGGGT
jgi:hypothetical protein